MPYKDGNPTLEEDARRRHYTDGLLKEANELVREVIDAATAYVDMIEARRSPIDVGAIDASFDRLKDAVKTLREGYSPKKPFLSEILTNEPIPIGKLAYFRERFRDRLYELIIEEFLKQEEATGLTRADVARRIHRRPEQITRWFGTPGNWTLETVSDLLLAISKAEPTVGLLPLEKFWVI